MMKPNVSTAGDKGTALHGLCYPGGIALTIEGVSHCYGTRQALDNVSFTVAPGSFTALLGLNGAGKSTLFLSSPGCSACKPDASAFSATISDASRARRYAAWAWCSSRAP